MGSKNKKSGKGGISHAKRKNIKGGKMSSGKKTKTKTVVLARRKLQAAVRKKLHQKKTFDPANTKAPEVNMDDVLDMIDDADLNHMRGEQFKDRQHLVTSEASKIRDETSAGRKRKKHFSEDSLEKEYENRLANEGVSAKQLKVFLPVKTNRGLQMQTSEVDEDEDEDVENIPDEEQKQPAKKQKSEEELPLKDTVFSLGKLVAERRSALFQYKLRIGTLSSAFLEDPQNRMKNLDALLMIMNGTDPAVVYTVPKLTALSLLAVFRDVLPSYAIKHTNPEGVKLKKDTLNLQTYEAMLLSKYKMYLKRSELLVTKYCPRKKPKTLPSAVETSVGEVALQCMCGMLVTHPYFNMSTNIINFVIPFLNNWSPSVRQIVFNSIKTVFRMDKRGEISYEIVRRINDLVKSKLRKMGGGVFHQDVLDVLLALRIKEADLEKEKEEEMSSTKKLTFEQRRMLSKRQRKKAKELVLLEKELLEASAEENKSRKSHFLTEVTKIVFTIYFRALKTDPNSKMLSGVLEGLSKFAHVINIDFFEDLMKVLEKLLHERKLKQRQLLLCIATVLTVLDGQGAALTMDPTGFHKSLYAELPNLRCGRMESDVGLALRCIALATGKKQMPGPRAVAFAKRLATIALQVEHHDVAGILMELKQLMRLHPSIGGLLDCDGSGASGVYLPELKDPDHSCASASTMWELTALMAHYHPWVSQTAKAFVPSTEKLPTELTKMHPHGICKAFDPFATMDFKPPLPERKTTNYKAKTRYPQFRPRTEYFRDQLKTISLEDTTIDTTEFYTE